MCVIVDPTSDLIYTIENDLLIRVWQLKQTLNYLAASKNKIGLLINFGEDSLKYKRVIL